MTEEFLEWWKANYDMAHLAMGAASDAWDAGARQERALVGTELAAAWREAHTCDDIKLDQPLDAFIADLRNSREVWRDRLETSEEFLGDAQAQIKELQKRLAEAEQGRDAACNEAAECYAKQVAAEAEIERMTPQFVAYDYLESPAGREMAEAELAKVRQLLIERDGGAHDQDCKALRDCGPRICNCGHDEVMAALFGTRACEA